MLPVNTHWRLIYIVLPWIYNVSAHAFCVIIVYCMVCAGNKALLLLLLLLLSLSLLLLLFCTVGCRPHQLTQRTTQINRVAVAAVADGDFSITLRRATTSMTTHRSAVFAAIAFNYAPASRRTGDVENHSTRPPRLSFSVRVESEPRPPTLSRRWMSSRAAAAAATDALVKTRRDSRLRAAMNESRCGAAARGAASRWLSSWPTFFCQQIDGVARFIDASIYRNTFPAIRIAILFFTIKILFLFF